MSHYHKSSLFSDTNNVCCNHPKIQTKRFFPLKRKCADRVANRVDPDQTAPLGAV